jgi:hypothetical protein
MSYDPALDPYASHAGFGVRAKTATAITASPSDLSPYPKAIVALVPAGTASPSITVKMHPTAETTTVIPLLEGVTVIDWVAVQAVTVIAAGVTVLRLDD